jgi:hypothetical protein
MTYFVNTAYGYKSFKFNATALWLNLPLEYDPIISELVCGQGTVPDQSLALPNSTGIFKNHLKRYYIDKQIEESD